MSEFIPKIEMWDIGKIIPYPNNAKLHTTDQVSRLAKQIKTTGWDVPIVVDRGGVIIKGHGRRLAAIHLKMKKAPVIVRTDLTQADVDAARLADNRVAMGDYDTELMQAELSKLSEMDYDLSTMGFDDKELSFLTVDPLDGFDNDAFDHPEMGGVDEVPGETKARVKIGKALGFDDISNLDLSTVKNFMAKIKYETGEDAAQAFILTAKSVLSK